MGLSRSYVLHSNEFLLKLVLHHALQTSDAM